MLNSSVIYSKQYSE